MSPRSHWMILSFALLYVSPLSWAVKLNPEGKSTCGIKPFFDGGRALDVDWTPCLVALDNLRIKDSYNKLFESGQFQPQLDPKRDILDCEKAENEGVIRLRRDAKVKGDKASPITYGVHFGPGGLPDYIFTQDLEMQPNGSAIALSQTSGAVLNWNGSKCQLRTAYTAQGLGPIFTKLYHPSLCGVRDEKKASAALYDSPASEASVMKELVKRLNIDPKKVRMQGLDGAGAIYYSTNDQQSFDVLRVYQNWGCETVEKANSGIFSDYERSVFEGKR